MSEVESSSASAMAFSKQQQSTIHSNMTATTTKAKTGSRTRLCVHTCLACIILALYVFNQRGMGAEDTAEKSSSVTLHPPAASTSQIRTSSLAAEIARDKLETPSHDTQQNNPLHPRKEGLSQHAKDFLLSRAGGEQDDSKEVSTDGKDVETPILKDARSVSNNQRLPPLETLLSEPSEVKRGSKRNSKNGNNDFDIIGNVQFLLDFAVVGFGKCGTTSLLQWLQEKSEPSTSGSLVRAPSFEAQYLVKQRPGQLVRKMYQFATEEEEAREAHNMLPHEKIIKGFKNPSDIRRANSRAILTQYWPETPLIVTVRHPVEWLVSLYNYFKIEKGRNQSNVTSYDMMAPGGRDQDGNTKHYVATAKGEFHAIMAEVGKTPLVADSPEWELLRPWLDPADADRVREQRMPNPIFFMEMKQLADTNATRAKQFANDLEAFLGLPTNHLPPAMHVRPNTDRIKLTTTDHLKMDICRPEFAPVLEEMVSISRSASLWFRQYFMASPDVTVSSPEYIGELLEAWMVDPCDVDDKSNNPH